MTKLLTTLAVAALALAPRAFGDAPHPITIGLVAKSQGNAVFQAARFGAEDAARELSAQYHLDIKIDWRTPNEEDPQKQAQAIEQLVLAGADGIAVSCSDANKLTDAINAAVDNGVPVATFDSDAPKSKRFVTYGIDDVLCGNQIMDELAKQLGGKGVIAILAGNQNAPNLQLRVRGVVEAAKNYPGITIRDTYFHKETPQDAVAKIEQVMQANPDISGWAMTGTWPLYTDHAVSWQPGTVKCVGVDAMPPELAYIRNGQVQVLLAQQCYAWGHRSVELLIQKIVFKKDPPAVKEVSALIPVTQANVDVFAKNWEKWLPK